MPLAFFLVTLRLETGLFGAAVSLSAMLLFLMITPRAPTDGRNARADSVLA